MPVFTNDMTNSKTIKLENTSGSRGIYLIWDDVNENLLSTIINNDVNYVPTPFPSESMFIYDALGSEKILDGEFPSTGIAYTGIKLIFDGMLGTNTTISSLNNSIGDPQISDNYIKFNYVYSGNSDTFDIVSFNKENTKSKVFQRTFDLKQILNTPVDWSGITPIQQKRDYIGLTVSFKRNVVGFTSVTSLNGVISNPVVFENKMKFDYRTPESANDTITFVGITDGIEPNNSGVNLSVSNLKVAPVIENFIVAPTARNHQYTGLQVKFSKNIQSCNITSDSGTITNSIVNNTDIITFDFLTPNTSQAIVSFNNIVATDGTIDIDLIESITVNLQSAPHSPSWFSNKPQVADQQYTNVQVQFSEGIQTPLPTVTTTDVGVIISNISIVDGRLQFNVLPSSNTAVYTFSNVKGINGGIASSLSLTLGPMLAYVYVNQNLRNLNEPDFKEYNPTDLSINVIKDAENIIRLSFTKLLQNTPIIPNFTNFTPTFAGIGALSKYYKYTPTTLGLTTFSTGELIGTDSSTSPSTDFKLNVISPQKIESVIASGQSSYITEMDVGTAYNLTISTSKDIDFSYHSNTKFESSDVSMIESASKQLTTTYTPTESDVGTKALNLTNTKAIDNFIYNLLTNQIIINPFVPLFGGIWNVSDSSSFVLSGDNVQSITASNTANKFLLYQNYFWNNSGFTSNTVKYIQSSPYNYLSFNHLLGGSNTSDNAGLYYKKDVTASYHQYTFTMVFTEPNSLTPTQTYADLPLLGQLTGVNGQYSIYHPPSGRLYSSGVTTNINELRVITVAVSSTVSSGHGNGSYYLKVDNNTALTGSDYLYDSSPIFIIGVNNEGMNSFRGKVFDIQIQNTMLSDAQITTLHNDLRMKYE